MNRFSRKILSSIVSALVIVMNQLLPFVVEYWLLR